MPRRASLNVDARKDPNDNVLITIKEVNDSQEVKASFNSEG